MFPTPCRAEETAYAYLYPWRRAEKNKGLQTVKHDIKLNRKFTSQENTTLSRIGSSHLKHPAKSFICFWIFLHSQRNIHPGGSNLLKRILTIFVENTQVIPYRVNKPLKELYIQNTNLPNNDRRISDGVNVGYWSSILWEELSQYWFILFWFNIKEGKCSSKPIFR